MQRNSKSTVIPLRSLYPRHPDRRLAGAVVLGRLGTGTAGSLASAIMIFSDVSCRMVVLTIVFGFFSVARIHAESPPDSVLHRVARQEIEALPNTLSLGNDAYKKT